MLKAHKNNIFNFNSRLEDIFLYRLLSSSMSSTLQCVFSLLSAIITANLIYMSKQLTKCIAKLSPNFTQYNLPGFEVKSFMNFLNVLISSTIFLLQILSKIPGPKSLPVIGAQWMYWKIFGIYTREKYHESNEEKLRLFGPVVREDVIWNFPLIHIFDSKVKTFY